MTHISERITSAGCVTVLLNAVTKRALELVEGRGGGRSSIEKHFTHHYLTTKRAIKLVVLHQVSSAGGGLTECRCGPDMAHGP